MEPTTVTTLTELTKWPEREDDVTVDGMLRIVGAQGQRRFLENWEALRVRGVAHDDRSAFQLETLRIEHVLACVGFMMAVRTLRDLNPAAAQEFITNYWTLCEAGDSVGEELWEYLEAAGLDPELIQL